MNDKEDNNSQQDKKQEAGKNACRSVNDLINMIIGGAFQLFLLLILLCGCWFAWVLLSVLGCFFKHTGG